MNPPVGMDGAHRNVRCIVIIEPAKIIHANDLRNPQNGEWSARGFLAGRHISTRFSSDKRTTYDSLVLPRAPDLSGDDSKSSCAACNANPHLLDHSEHALFSCSSHFLCGCNVAREETFCTRIDILRSNRDGDQISRLTILSVHHTFVLRTCCMDIA